jgi:hypothetical protein
VYSRVRSWDEFQPWLDRIVHFPEEIIDDALKQTPPAWIAEDDQDLQRLLHMLMHRRKRVPDLIREAAAGTTNPFPNWRAR